MAVYVLVGAGAAAGALARWLLLAIASSPLMLLLINAAGSYALGVLTRRHAPAYATTGFCGGFTSFSAYVAIAAHSPLYAVITIVVCVLACLWGLRR